MVFTHSAQHWTAVQRFDHPDPRISASVQPTTQRLQTAKAGVIDNATAKLQAAGKLLARVEEPHQIGPRHGIVARSP
jgi:hypothetical protein